MDMRSGSAVERATQVASRYINRKVSLISSSDVRYSGELYTVDPNETSIALKNVDCLGTENRRQGSEAISASECTYEFIIFRANNTKSLTLEEGPRHDLTNEILEPLKMAKYEIRNEQAQQKQAQQNRRVGYPTGIDHDTEFREHLSLQECETLKVHDKVDHRDFAGKFIYATIVEKKGYNLKIHYEGWSIEWDCWSDYEKEIYRFAKAGSISQRPAHRFKNLKKDDFIDINPIRKDKRGWRTGQIRIVDVKSGQVQIAYEKEGESPDNYYKYWCHLDSTEEIAQFASKSAQIDESNNNQTDENKNDTNMNENMIENNNDTSNSISNNTVNNYNELEEGIVDSETMKVRSWIYGIFCNNNDMAQNYFRLLINQGFDDMNVISTLSENDLKQIGINKLGHRRKISLAVEKLKK